jgi:hypothetical protein
VTFAGLGAAALATGDGDGEGDGAGEGTGLTRNAGDGEGTGLTRNAGDGDAAGLAATAGDGLVGESGVEVAVETGVDVGSAGAHAMRPPRPTAHAASAAAGNNRKHTNNTEPRRSCLYRACTIPVTY